MKIATHLRVHTLLAIGAVVVIGMGLLFAFFQVQGAMQRAEQIENLVGHVFEMNLLATEFVVDSSRRAKKQWLSRHQATQALIGQISGDTSRERQLQETLVFTHAQIKEIFLLLVEQTEDPSVANDLANPLRPLLTRQLLLKSQSLFTDIQRLERLTFAHFEGDLQYILDLGLGLVGGMALLLTLYGGLIVKTIVNPIHRLLEGARQIGAGRFEHRMVVENRDEIGELSRSFNHMAENLENNTVSRHLLLAEIAERKVIEQGLSLQKKRVDTLLEAMPAFVYLQGSDYTIHYANKEFEKIFGPVNQRVCYQAIQNRESPCPECPTFKVFETKEPQTWEWNTSDGRCYIIYDHPFTDPDGTALVLEFGIDITQRKLAESQLHESQERFRRYFDQGVTGMAITSPAKGWLAVNDRLCQDLGYGRSELLSMTWAEVTHPEDLAADVANFDRLMQGEINHYTMEKRFIRKDGTLMDAFLAVGCLRNKEGGVWEIQAMVQDISEKKRQEAELRQYREDLEQKVLERTQQLSQANQMLGQEAAIRQEVAASLLRQNQLLDSVRRVQAMFIGAMEPAHVFNTLLEEILRLTASPMGFIAMVEQEGHDSPVLRALAITDIAWDAPSRQLYIKNGSMGFCFPTMQGLHAAAITGRQVVIANDPAHDGRSKGTPTGHPPLHTFLGIPLWQGEEVIGTIGLANRPEGYQESLVTFIAPVVEAVAQIVMGFRHLEARNRTEQALRENQESLAQAQKIARLGSWDWDIQQGRLTCSPELLSIFNLDRWPAGLSFQDGLQEMVAVADQERVAAAFQQLLTDPTAVYDLEYTLANHRVIHGRSRVSRDEDGQPVRMAGTVHDISRRIQWEKSLKESEERYRQLFAQNQAVFLLIDPADGSIVDANQAAEKYYGYSHSQFIQLNIADINILAPDQIAQEMALAKSQQRTHFYFHHRLASGEVRDVEVYSGPVRLAGKDILYSIIHDVTVRKQTEQALKQTLELLSRNETQLRQAKDEAEHANKAKTQFLAAMSHDIRTPMNAILGMGELLLQSDVTGEQQKFLSLMMNAGETLLALINDILDLSKIEAGQMHLEQVPFVLSEVVHNVVAMLETRVAQKGVALTCQWDEQLPVSVVGDPQRLTQILINLLGNAIKFTTQGEIALSVSHRPANRGLFAIRDSGIGVAAHRLDSIFQPFVQADVSTFRRFGGTGLGLAICQQIVHRMSGQIWVESQEGVGSTFYFEIPLEPYLAAQTSLSAPSSSSLSGTLAYKTADVADPILLVDDSEDNTLLIEAYLRNSRYHLETAGDGREAVDKFQKGRYSLVFMDIQMPIMDGLAAIQWMRDYEKTTGAKVTPIIALSANAMKEEMQQAMEAGCDLYLSKPIKKSRLLEVLDQIFR